MSVKYSFIIPTLNEELYLNDVIDSIKSFEDYEIIIVDGGSSDKTIEIAQQHNVNIVNSVIGRGTQLNNGAFKANGDILCFLHSDTTLPKNAFELVNSFFSENANKICRFKLGFDIDHWLLNRYKNFSKFNSIFTRFGDMFIAVRKDFFLELGGFPNWKTFEDVDFLKRATSKAKIGVLGNEVISSARTFIKYGFVNQQIYNGYLMVKYLLGLRKFIEENKYYSRIPKKNKASILVFAKYPKEGKVKTRLAKTVGDKKAAQIYSTIAKELINTIKEINSVNKYIFYSEKHEKDLVIKWINENFLFALQKGNDLGERMKNSFKLVFGHEAKKAIIIGTDVPELDSEILNKAITKLDKYDIALGPSPDGGFYLLGMKKYNPKIFEGITYSTNSVLSETIKKIEDEKLTYFLLEPVQDIDTEEELKSWLSNSKKNQLKNKIADIYI